MGSLNSGAWNLWKLGAKFDPRIALPAKRWREVSRKQVTAEPYKREVLFSRMSKGEVVLFSNLKVPVARERELGLEEAVLTALADGLPDRTRAKVWWRRSFHRKSITIRELLKNWREDRGPMNIADLHIRDTGLYERIDTSSLCNFNLLSGARGECALEEILSMIVSTTGAFTDSHTDDPDGSNHCFVGRKLWLAWDTFEGIENGLEDVDRQQLARWAAFDIEAFLRLRSSRWIIVEPGQTLFLPGHLTHRVITLERYLEVGGFFVMFPSLQRTLARWRRDTPLWALTKPLKHRLTLVDQIARRANRKAQQLRLGDSRERRQWGLNWFATS